METRKITAKITTKLLHSFSAQLDALFLKRDAYLDHVLTREIAELRTDLAGCKLSPKAKRFISGELKKTGTSVINVTISRETADALDAVVAEGNLVRDAFLNRLIALLRCGETVRKVLEVPRTIDGRGFALMQGMPVSPMEAMEELRDDPLFYLRQFVQDRHEEGLYTVAGFPFAFCCYVRDEVVPHTAANRKLRIDLELDSFEKEFFTPRARSTP